MERFVNLGKEMGYEGVALQEFVAKQQELEIAKQALEREERALEREARKQAEEARKQAEEAKRKHEIEIEEIRFKQMEHAHHLNLTAPKVKMENNDTDTGSAAAKAKKPSLPPFKEGEDIDSYLHRFERVARASEWKENTWAPYLSALLSGDALEVYSRLSDSDAGDYQKVKEAVLKRYKLTEKGYRAMFRNEVPKYGESPDQYVTRIGNYLDRWVDLSGTPSTYAGLRELIVKEQFLDSCPADLAVFLGERKPKTLAKLEELSEQFLLAHDRDLSTGVRPRSSPKPNRKPYPKLSARSAAQTPSSGRSSSNRGGSDGSFPWECHYCHKTGHKKADCPRRKETALKKSMFAHGRYKFWDEALGEENEYCSSGLVNGQRVKVYRDTGSSMTYVNRRLVPSNAYQEDSIKVRLANGTVDTIPTAQVELEVGGTRKKVEVGVMDTPYPVLLGNDYEMACVATRAQTKKQEALARKVAEDEKRTGVRPSPLVLEQDEEDIQSEEEDSASSRQEEIVAQPPTVFDVKPDELRKQQLKDVSLQSAWEDAVSEVQAKELETCFVKNRDGFLMRKWTQLLKHGPATEGSQAVMQVVVPAVHRQEVLRLAHSIPLSGHMGIARTKERVLKHFYWPGVIRDVKKFRRSCPECQKTATRRADDRHTMVCPPVIGEPFRRLGIDIVGPLPRSNSGNKYVLTIIDHATRFPEAVAMPSMEAERVVKELITFFTRVGIPEEMLSDQGANFMAAIT
ncbi:uncharacterized protein LOC144861313 [Branchiostoma floridae x Branchiostoma japonicum]